MSTTTKELIRIGHRGAKGLAPENTLKAFRHALEHQAHFVELDVYRCKSGELVVHHDFRVDRTTNGEGLVEELTLDQLRALDAGDGENVPLLSEVIELIDGRAGLDIEIKSQGFEEQLLRLLESYLDRGWSRDSFIITSYYHESIKRCKELNPSFKTGALYYGVPIDLAASAVKSNADFLILDIDVPSKALVDDAHKHGLGVLICTVNHPEDMKIVRDMGVDGIISDFPDRLYAELA